MEKTASQPKNDNNRKKNAIVLTGAGAVAAAGAWFLFSALNERKRKNKQVHLPGLHIHLNLSASEIAKVTDNIIAKSRQVYDSVASIPPEKVTYMSTVSVLADLEAEQFPLIQSCILQKLVSCSEDVQKASSEAEKRIDAHVTSCSKREDIYRIIKKLASGNERMSIEAKRYTFCLVKEFERSGTHLALSKREEVDRLRRQIEDLTLRYAHNLKEDRSFLLFSESELAGVPLGFIKSLERVENGKLKISLRNHHTSLILENCKVGVTRKAVAVGRGQRCGKENMKILENLVQKRHKLAKLLGYPNFADFALEPRMAKTSAKVFKFLEDMSSSLDELAGRELMVLKALKKEEEGESPFGMEDMLYYMRKAKEQEIGIDFGVAKDYFPVKTVLSGVLKIFQELFGLIFEEIKGGIYWNKDVLLYSVLDIKSSELMGYIYLDLYSREGKYAHACVLPLQNGCLSRDGSRQIPAAALLAQFPRDVDNDYGLLSFPDVVTLFHEFGHVIHHICSRATFARFSGLRSEADFVELSSQMLENWCYESIPLKMMSGHLKDTVEPITDKFCQALKKSRNVFAGLKMKQEILYCLLDQMIHSGEKVDMLEIFRHLHPKIMMGIPSLGGTNPAACDPRLAIGYEATCYSHIWNEVFSADLFTSKFEDDLLNQFVGIQFRNKVYAPGGSSDAIDLLSDFLGREPSIQSFIERKKMDSLFS